MKHSWSALIAPMGDKHFFPLSFVLSFSPSLCLSLPSSFSLSRSFWISILGPISWTFTNSRVGLRVLTNLQMPFLHVVQSLCFKPVLVNKQQHRPQDPLITQCPLPFCVQSNHGWLVKCCKRKQRHACLPLSDSQTYSKSIDSHVPVWIRHGQQILLFHFIKHMEAVHCLLIAWNNDIYINVCPYIRKNPFSCWQCDKNMAWT